MNPFKMNIILIGMPGSGKSTVGVVLAKQAGLDFLDTDIIIQSAAGRPLQEIVDTEGHMVLRRIEEEVLLKLDCRNHVIATGGSAAYSRAAMEHLKSGGTTVFLDAEIGTLQERVKDFSGRGLAKRPEQTFEDIYAERVPLYRMYADITVRCDGISHEEVSSRIMELLAPAKP